MDNDFLHKIINGDVGLYDQEQALKEPWTAYEFAYLNLPGTDIKKCQIAACKDSECAYYFAKNILEADIKLFQKAACKDSWWAYIFAKKIPGANIKSCQYSACKNLYSAYCFARDIPGADIEYCRKSYNLDSEMLKEFDLMIAIKALL